MSRIFCLAIALAILLVPSAKAESIILCGADTVFVVEPATATKGKIEKTCSWNAKQHDQLPEAARRTMPIRWKCCRVTAPWWRVR